MDTLWPKQSAPADDGSTPRFNSISQGPRRLSLGMRFQMRLMPVFLVAFLIAGCTPNWQCASAPDVRGPNSLANVHSFIATNGPNTYTNEANLDWEDFEPKVYISGLPWKKWNAKRFQARTSDGILYVLIGDAFHHDYYGVAYNPSTNHFPRWIRFKPVGDHWYVWLEPEFLDTSVTTGSYE